MHHQKLRQELFPAHLFSGTGFKTPENRDILRKSGKLETLVSTIDILPCTSMGSLRYSSFSLVSGDSFQKTLLEEAPSSSRSLLATKMKELT